MNLNDMTTAPRDGSEVLARHVNGNQIVVTWKYDPTFQQCFWWDRWAFYGEEAFSGWLNFTELQKDAARLDYLEREMDVEQALLNHTDQKPSSLFRRNQPITRAAIDKEMGNGA